VGDGWWAWWIQLKSGEVSIGAVIDQRLCQWPDTGATVGDKLRTFLSRHPAAREMMKNADFIQGDVHFRRNLPYRSERFAGDGFAIIGDAAAFIDPLYSPGMDWIAYTVAASTDLVLKWREGAEMPPLVEKHNRDFSVSYDRMFGALYQDKYEYLGDYDLMRVAFRLDIASYYLYIARFLYQKGPAMLAQPPFSPWQAGPFFRFMRFYNRRLAAMARSRRERSTYGFNNDHHRDLVPGFNFRLGQLFKTVLHGLAIWIKLEITEGRHSWFGKSKTMPAPASEQPIQQHHSSQVPRALG
jgi:hypothetical protein